MFSKRLQQLRKSHKLTQDELATRLNINRGTYANYERGHRQPDFETLQKIADYFDVTTDYLLGRDDNTQKSSDDNSEFEAWLNDPRIAKMYSEFKESSEERREALLAAWEYLKSLDKK